MALVCQKKGADIEGYVRKYDVEWSADLFKQLLDTHEKSKKNLEKLNYPRKKNINDLPNLSIGYKSNNRHYITDHHQKSFTIKCPDDMAKGTFKQLLELGERGLSDRTPSLAKLKQPIAEDPQTSIPKHQRGYINPSLVSYTQSQYK